MVISHVNKNQIWNFSFYNKICIPEKDIFMKNYRFYTYQPLLHNGDKLQQACEIC